MSRKNTTDHAGDGQVVELAPPDEVTWMADALGVAALMLTDKEALR